jgi:hypothetical protein
MKEEKVEEERVKELEKEGLTHSDAIGVAMTEVIEKEEALKDKIRNDVEQDILKQDEENDCSEDYPLGGMLEPYDIEKEKDL